MIPPAYISFTAPAMAAGIVMLGLPILAHLWARQTRRLRVYPSFRLLQESIAEQTRMRKLRRWILLALRCLVVAALVAAFVQPVWRASRAEALAATQQNAVVLVIDASASMQAQHQGTPLWEVARASASRILGDLRRGVDVANVIWATAQPAAVFVELSPNTPALQQEVMAKEVSFEHADAVAALQAAGNQLRSFSGPKRVVILSDLQTSNWQSVLDANPEDLLPPGTQWTAMDLNTSRVANVSLGQPRCEPLRPFAGQTVSLVAPVHNHSDRTQQARVSIRIEGQELPPQNVALEPGQVREVAFSYRLPDTRPRCVELEMNRDAFVVDDRAATVIRPQAAIPVGVLSDDDWNRVGSASFYLSLALAPHGDRNDRFTVKHLNSRDLEQQSALQGQVAVFVGYLGMLEPDAARQLASYVRDGGAIVWFSGNGPVQRNLQTLESIDPDGWLPWQPGTRRDLARSGDYAYFQGGQWRSRLLRDFDAASQLALGEIRFASRWDIAQVRGDAEILLRFQDGTPALAVRSYGTGQVVLANFSPDSQSSEFGKYGSFVALTQVLAQNLQTATAVHATMQPGDTLTHRVEIQGSPTTIELYDPDEQLLAPVRTMLQDAVELQWSPVAHPGCYRIRQTGEVIDAVAVNLDPRESELTTLPLESFRGGQTNPGLHLAGPSGDAWQRPIDLRGQPLWGMMVLAAMAALGIESGLLAWWRQAS